MKTNAMKKFYLGAAATASLGILASGVSAAPMVNIEYLSSNYECIAAECVDLANGGYTVEGGAVVDPADTVLGDYKAPGFDTGNAGNVSSFNVTSAKDVPGGALTPVTVTGLDNVFELYWGSIDAYNVITFSYENGVNDVVTLGSNSSESITGVDARAAIADATNEPVPARVDGYFRFAGNSDFYFNQVELSSEGVAFEFATAAVPEPGTLALLGLGLTGLGAARRRKLAA